MVGTKLPNQVPLSVVKSTIWQPENPSAEAETKSLPREERRYNPFFQITSPYSNTSTILAEPPFCVQPKDLSSSVLISPSLFTGDGFP